MLWCCISILSNAGKKNHMKINTIFFTMIIGAFMLLSINAYGQDPTEMTQNESDRMDRFKTEYEDEQIKKQETSNKTSIEELQDQRNASKVKAREAKRIQLDANKALRQSKKALAAEKTAQKARKDAIKQNQKSLDAIEKSDGN